MWKDLMEFLDIVTTHQHLDVAYVIQKLRLSKAFIFTAMPKHLSFGRPEFMLGVDGTPLGRRSHEKDKYIEELVVNRGITRSLAAVESEYNEVRDRLFSESTASQLPELKKSLCMSQDNFTSEIDKLLDTYSGQKTASSIFKPSELTATQRPVPNMPDICSTEIFNPVEDGEEGDEEEDKKRAIQLKTLKESAFSASASKGSETEEKKTPGRTYYKRSAMLEPYQQKGWQKTKRAKHQTFRIKEGEIEDFD